MFNKRAQVELKMSSPVLSEDNIENEVDVEPISKTLMHGYGETYVVDDMENRVIDIAPSNNDQPLGMFQDKYFEELNFLTLFFGLVKPKDIFQQSRY